MEPTRVKRPDSHRDVVHEESHRCDIKLWKHLLTESGTLDLDKAKGDEDVLAYPVGVYGEGTPIGAAFQATAECWACGDYVTKWFVWS